VNGRMIMNSIVLEREQNHGLFNMLSHHFPRITEESLEKVVRTAGPLAEI